MVLFTPIRVVSPGFRQRGVEWDGGCEASANPSISDRWRRPGCAGIPGDGWIRASYPVCRLTISDATPHPGRP